MAKRLTDAKRAEFENRLRKIIKAFQQEPGKISAIVDRVGVGNSDIKKAVEDIMRAMETEDGLGKVSASMRKKLATALIRQAEGLLDENESPLEEANDLSNPVLHPVEDLEHEIQTMDDQRLIDEVNLLEEHMKEDLNQPPQADAPGDMGEQPMNLNPEQRLAILLQAPANVKQSKAAALRALADTLDSKELDVSNNHDIDSNEQPGNALLNHYEEQETGSMTDSTKPAVNASFLKEQAKSLLANFEENSVMHLALRHLSASLEDMEKADKSDESKAVSQEDAEEAKTKNDEAKKENDESGRKSLKEDNKNDSGGIGSIDRASVSDGGIAADASMDVKKSILRAKLSKLKRDKEVIANVDHKNMPTPKQLPKPEGTTEDTLSGDAPIQYSPATGETMDQEIHTKREKVPGYKETTGTDEPNEIYQGNTPESAKDVQTTSDSNKGLNNKRLLKDMEPAVQKATPEPQEDAAAKGNAGTHQNAKEWETVKKEVDKTPTGERVIHTIGNLEDEINKRVTRAVDLASLMTAKNLIATSEDLSEKIKSFAMMDDNVFATVEKVIASTSTPKIVQRAEERLGPEARNEDREESSESPRKLKRIDEEEAPGDADKTASLRKDASQMGGGLTRIIQTAREARADINQSRKSVIAAKLNEVFAGDWTIGPKDDVAEAMNRLGLSK